MATILPFNALRYNPAKIKDLSKVMAPPYDILSAKDQDFYYNLHSNNIVKLDFGKEMSGDSPDRNKYTRSATMLRLSTEQDILKKDLKPGFYVVGQDFTAPNGKKKSFLGLVSMLKLEPYKNRVALPHEKTLSKPKSDRLDLTRQTRANLSQIFMLFEDKKAAGQKWLEKQAKGKAAFDLKSNDGVRHRLWPVFASPAIKAMQKMLAKQPLYIADGHHRYETMLNYAAEAKKNKAAACTMVCLAPMSSPGLLVLPTHRMLFNVRNFQGDAFKSRLKEYFDVQALPSLDALTSGMEKAQSGKSPRHAFGLVLPGMAPYSLLLLKPGLKPEELVEDKRSKAYKHLDVSLLQAVILEKMLGMTVETIAAQQNLHYSKSARQAADSVASGEHQAALLLNATRIEEVRDVSLAKDVMPQKSTYFLPKLLTGLVLRKIE